MLYYTTLYLNGSQSQMISCITSTTWENLSQH